MKEFIQLISPDKLMPFEKHPYQVREDVAMDELTEWRSCSVPMKSKLVYLPPAQHDFEEIVKYHITEAGTPYARKIYSTMKTTIDRLRDFPLMGQTHPDPVLAANGYRKLVLTKTYVAVYKVIGNTVYIYAVVNGTTDYPRLLK